MRLRSGAVEARDRLKNLRIIYICRFRSRAIHVDQGNHQAGSMPKAIVAEDAARSVGSTHMPVISKVPLSKSAVSLSLRRGKLLARAR